MIISTMLVATALSGAPALLASQTFAADARLEAALIGEHRSEQNRSRDRFRNPKATLSFFGLAPGMTVVELSPGAGWYTEVLAPVLRDDGRLIVAPPADNERAMEVMRRSREIPPLDGIELTGLDAGRMPAIADSSVDMVLTFRNLHNWMNAGVLDAMFADAARVLKPGGVLGVVEHRASDGDDPVASSRRGYLSESYVIERAQAAGLVLDARSDINANPADTKDYDGGVWALPPVRRGDRSPEERARLDAIGESDRMTLKFVKPAPTTATEGLPPDLAKAVHDYDQATFQNDMATYRTLVADEYLMVNSDSSTENKEQSILPFQEATFKIDPYENREPLQIVWENGAVLGGLLLISWTQDGVHQTRLVRTSHVWAKRDGRWQLMYTQVTRVPQ